MLEKKQKPSNTFVKSPIPEKRSMGKTGRYRGPYIPGGESERWGWDGVLLPCLMILNTFSGVIRINSL